MTLRILGIGAPAAGDDAVGLLVLEQLRREAWPEGTELHAITEPAQIVSLLPGADAVILVDAVLGAPPGVVMRVDARALARERILPWSTHGLGVVQALELARRLGSGYLPGHLELVGVGIERAEPGSSSLSPAVQAAIPRAVAHVREAVRAMSLLAL